MQDEGCARYFDVKCLGRIGPGFWPEEGFFKRYVSRSVDGCVWHGDPAKGGQFIADCWMSILSSSWNQSNGSWSARFGPGAGVQCDEVGSAGVGAHHVHQQGPDLKFISKTVMSMNAKSLEITKSLLRKIARHLEDKPVLECIHAYQIEVAECMAFGDGDSARDRETRRLTTAMLEKLGKPLH